MNRRMLFFLIVLTGLSACDLIDSQSGKKSSKKMTYSFKCIDSTVSGSETNKAISKTTSIIRDLAVKPKEITDSVQNAYGVAFHQDAIETKSFVLINDPAINAQLQKILSDLLAVRENPSQINYSIYLLDDAQINSFTFGGHIYVTKGMYDKCEGKTSLLYFIVGHEIGHSEKGHIKKTIQEMELSDKLFGEEHGIDFFEIKKLLTGSFNQRNELEADYYGIDLTYRLNMDVCSAVEFWKQMAKTENNYSKLEDFFRTHPFSSLRAQCLQDHIQQNFGTTCR